MESGLAGLGMRLKQVILIQCFLAARVVVVVLVVVMKR
jgi:hypothetical protein